MTSRVQKGGATFKPVARPKGKNRETSTAPVRASVPPSQVKDARRGTPAASIAPDPSPAASSSNIASTTFEDIADLVSPPPSVPAESFRQFAPPAISSSGGATSNPIRTPATVIRTNAFSPSPFQSNQASQSSTSLVAPPTLPNPPASQLANPDPDLPDDDDLPPMPVPTAGVQPSAEPQANDEPAQSSGPQRRTRKKSATQQSEGEDTPEPRPRKRAKKSTVEATPSAEGEPSVAGKRKIRARKGRAQSPPENPLSGTADPGEDLDPTTVKMSDLCEDTGQGRVSTKVTVVMESHRDWKIRNREKKAQKIMEMELRKLGKDDEADEVGAPPVDPAEENASGGDAVAAALNSSTLQAINGGADDPEESDIIDESGQGFDYSQMFQSSQANVRVRIGPNGETIIDEQSLLVDRQEGDDDTSHYTHINESDHTKFTNSATYQRKGGRGHRWSAEETELFYHALGQFGENYEMISIMLPGRDRTACKNKFKAEDKRNPARITDFLKNRIPIDMKALEQRTGKDFSGPTPVIRTPQPFHPPTPAQVKERRHTTPPRANPGRKRSRSRTAGLEEGVEVLGSIDDIPMPDDD